MVALPKINHAFSHLFDIMQHFYLTTPPKYKRFLSKNQWKK
jgi:hypothetical protein